MKKHYFKKWYVAIISVFFFLSIQFAEAQLFSPEYESAAKEMEQLVNDYTNKKITDEVYIKKMTELNTKMTAALQNSKAEIEEAKGDAEQTVFLDEDLLVSLYEEMKQTEAAFRDEKINKNEYNQRCKEIKNKIDKEEAPYNTRCAELQAQIEQADVDAKKGTITSKQAFMKQTELSNQITVESVQIERIQEKIHDRWPGTCAGWPKAEGEDSVFKLTDMGPFHQTKGTRASYNATRMGFNGPINSFTIFQTNANEKVFLDLKEQIEKITGKPMEALEKNKYAIKVKNSKGNINRLELIFKNGNRVILDISKQHE